MRVGEEWGTGDQVSGVGLEKFGWGVFFGVESFLGGDEVFFIDIESGVGGDIHPVGGDGGGADAVEGVEQAGGFAFTVNPNTLLDKSYGE